MGHADAPGPGGGLRRAGRRTYVPGPTGLDDPPQVVVEIFQPGSPFSGTARTYTYLRDEQGTVVGLVAEDEGSDPQAPPVPVRYRYTPYGEAHAESRPELLRGRFDAEAVEAATMGGTVTQSVADPALAAAGGLVLDWSLTLDPASLDTGLAVGSHRPRRSTAGGGRDLPTRLALSGTARTYTGARKKQALVVDIGAQPGRAVASPYYSMEARNLSRWEAAGDIESTIKADPGF